MLFTVIYPEGKLLYTHSTLPRVPGVKHEKNMETLRGQKDPKSKLEIELRTVLLWDVSADHWSIVLATLNRR